MNRKGRISTTVKMIVHMKKINYGKLTITLLVIAIAVRLGLAFLYTVSGDACWHLSVAKFISVEHKLPVFETLGRDEPFWAPPLFHVIAAFFYALFGEIGMKLVSPLFGSAALIVGWLILRKFLNDRAVFFGMLFLSFLPIMIDYSILGYGESVLTFFVLLSIYLAFGGRFAWSGAAAGLAILSKYNGAFVVPVLLFLAYTSSRKKDRWKNMALACIIPGLVAFPWLLRNFLVLGYPVWPFLNFIFPGAVQGAYSGFSILNIFSWQTLASLYLGFFGVPDGNYRVLSFFSLPFFWAFFAGFIAVTAVFLAPLMRGVKKKKGDMVWWMLLGSFGLLFLLYVANVGPFVSRMLMPALIALAFFYGRGADALLGERGMKGWWKERLLLVVLVIIGTGFVLILAGKFFLATQAWGFYQEDFDWVRENTPQDAVFLAGGQCVPFHIGRSAVSFSHTSKRDYEYVWINQNFALDRRSILDEGQLKELEQTRKERVYSSQRTGTAVYKAGQ